MNVEGLGRGLKRWKKGYKRVKQGRKRAKEGESRKRGMNETARMTVDGMPRSGKGAQLRWGGGSNTSQSSRCVEYSPRGSFRIKYFSLRFRPARSLATMLHLAFATRLTIGQKNKPTVLLNDYSIFASVCMTLLCSNVLCLQLSAL